MNLADNLRLIALMQMRQRMKISTHRAQVRAEEDAKKAAFKALHDSLQHAVVEVQVLASTPDTPKGMH